MSMQYAAAIVAGLVDELRQRGYRVKEDESALYGIVDGNHMALFSVNGLQYKITLNGPFCELDYVDHIVRYNGDDWKRLDLVARVDTVNPALFDMLIDKLVAYIARRARHSWASIAQSAPFKSPKDPEELEPRPDY